MVLALGGRDYSSKHKHYALGISVMRPKWIARWTQQSTTLWCLFDSTMRKVDSTNVVLGYSPSEATGKNWVKKKLNSIALTDLVSGALAMHDIRVTAKLDSVTY